jgi:hypothetical protein
MIIDIKKMAMRPIFTNVDIRLEFHFNGFNFPVRIKIISLLNHFAHKCPDDNINVTQEMK